MTLAPVARKILLTLHIAVSVGWMGAAAAYVTLNVPALTEGDEQAVRAAYLMMPIVFVYALVPLAVATVVTGVALALGSKWGLFQHYWVTVSLGVTLFAAAILVLHLPAVNDQAAIAADRHGDVFALGGDLFHSVGGFVVLSVPLVLNVVKPRGLTRRGWRMQEGRRNSPTPT